jgi:hypothetical protein
MMKHLLFVSALLLVFSYSYAQKITRLDYSNIITAKKIMLKYQDNADDSLMIPIVSDKYPELKNALCDTNLFFGNKLDTVIKRYQTDGSGITSFYYGVTFVNKDIISLRLYYETMGAYPDNFQELRTLNIHTGAVYPISKEINPKGLEWIYSTYKELLKQRILKDESGLDKEKVDENSADIYRDLKESADTLASEEVLKNYIFTDKGVSVTTNGILPHVVKDFEPERNWFVPYNKLKPYILTGAVVLK